MNRFLRTILATASAAIVLAACTGEPLATSPDADGLDPAAIELAANAGRPVADRYIVVFRAGIGDPDALTDALVRGSGGTVHFRYETALQGFAATLPAAAVEAIRRNPNVAYVEHDSVVTIVATQTNATWGLDRIDQRALPLNGTYTQENTGKGVRAYIIDTGIRTSHVDFGGRASGGFSAFSGGSEDCNGHGTHVAGTVGGTTWGVAKDVALVAVRVLDCNGSGTTSGVIAGIDWVTADYGRQSQPAVANMSLGGGASSSLDQAVSNSIAAGITYAVAAGNGDRLGRQQDACNYSPARVPAAITIGATTNADAKTSWSNYGPCVDWFAPGASITSAWHTSTTATNTISGTSMATPHVAGAAALHLSANPGSTPQQVHDHLFAATTKGIVTSSSTTNNHLLYTLTGGTTTPDPEPEPVGGATLSAVGYKVKGGWQRVDLTWSGVAGTNVDIYRSGTKVGTTANDGAHTDDPNKKGSGAYTYEVCAAGTTTCSNAVTVTF
jgi:subtilisin family serine protease